MKSSIFTLFIFFSFIQLTNAQYPNVRVSSPSSTDPNETSIAINPIDPTNLVAGANIRYFYYSTNSGSTWTQGNMSSPLGVWGDPCVIFDLFGHVYFGHLSNPASPGYWIDRIVVQKSTNKGVTWSSGVGIGFNPPVRAQDKEWIAVDWTNSLYRNNLYMAWTEFDNYGSSNSNDSSRILFSRSTDSGETWSAPYRISEKGGDCIDEDNTVEGAVPAVGPNGEVYLSWAGPLGLVFDKSTDGGATWGLDKVITSIPGGWDFNVPGIYRCNGLPVTACDISNSPYRGNIYINWSDQRNGTNNTDIFIVKSTNGGTTWTNPKRVNSDIGSKHQFFTWMAVDPGTGIIYIVYYDRRNYSDNQTDVYVARSTDGGDTFNEFKVSQSPFTPTSSVFFGDYTNIAALNGKVYPIWTRLESGQRSVWIAIVQDSLPNQATSTFSSKAGWNLLSSPLTVGNMTPNTVFPGAVSYAYTYEDNYSIKDTLKVGRGYWLKFDTPQNHTLIGTQLQNVDIPIRAGWNIIGSLNGNIPINSISTNPPGIISSSFFEYDGGYQTASEIKKGRGYWIKSSSAGTLNLAISTFKPHLQNYESDFSGLSSLIFSDGNNLSSLFIAHNVVDHSKFELPPKPPAGIFDIRFSDNSKIILTNERKVVQIAGTDFPLRIQFKSTHSDLKVRLRFLDGTSFILIEGTELSLSNEQTTFEIEVIGRISEKILSQNYPNPFNSKTKINFSISGENHNHKQKVMLKVYDVLGRLIAVALEDEINVGFRTFEFDADRYNLVSGVYFYELIAIDQSSGSILREVKKMNYLK